MALIKYLCKKNKWVEKKKDTQGHIFWSGKHFKPDDFE